MPRDRPAASGQDSTADGQFPSDLGGDKAAPNLVEETNVAKHYGNFGGGNYFAFAWNSQLIGGGRKGIYKGTLGNFPLRGEKTSFNTFTSSTVSTLNTSSSSISLTGDFMLAPNMNVFVSGFPESLTQLGISASVYDVSQNLFTTVENGSREIVFDGLNLSASDSLNVETFGNLAIPAPFVEYPAGSQRALKRGIAEADTVFNFASVLKREIQILPIPNGSTTIGASVSADPRNSVTGFFSVGMEFAVFNKSSLDSRFTRVYTQ